MLLLTRAAPAAIALLLSACGALNPFGSSRTEPVPRSTPPGSTAGSGVPAPAPVLQRRGGAYYQDDGPGDSAPPNLDATPDAVPKDEPPLRSATNRTYVVFGKTYTPITDERPFSQRGIGSWYGRKFHGQKTSSGEPYDMYAMTAAHPTLPIPSYVRVTNVTNGRSVVVRVNDRGPFHSDRVIDLSYTAALKLDYVNQGSTLVDVARVRAGDRTLVAANRVGGVGGGGAAGANGTGSAAAGAPAVKAAVSRQIAQAPTPKPASTNASGDDPLQNGSQSGSAATSQPVIATPEPATVNLPTTTQPDGVYLQIGAFGARENAESFRTRVSQQLAWLTEAIFVVSGNNLHRLQVGPYKSRDEAGKIAEKIRETLQLKPVFVLR